MAVLRRIKFRVFLLLLAGLVPAWAQQTSLTIVSAAGYQAGAAPDSWAAAFGAGITNAAVIAQPGADGQFPTVVAGITVDVDGVLARIYFVSPNQVNFVFPAEIPVGLSTVTIRSANSQVVFSGQVNVRRTLPAIFSQDSSGAGPGSILNGVTYLLEPFLVDTTQNPGDDKRTRLSVFGTGFRGAGTLTAEATTPSGEKYFLTVEYFGEAPGYVALDQANVVLPPELDGAGIVSLVLRADGVISNIVTFDVASLAANRIRLVGVSLSQTVILGGQSVTGRVQLNGKSPATAVIVNLRSNNAIVTVPPDVIVPPSATTAEFNVDTLIPLENRQVQITARAGGDSFTATLTVATGILIANITLDPDEIQGGANTIGTVRLQKPLPSGSMRVTLSADSDRVTIPETVTLLAGQSAVDFLVSTTAVDAIQQVTIRATGEVNEVSAGLRLLPPLMISVNPSSPASGSAITIQVTLGTPAPLGGANVNLHTSGNDLILPGFVEVPFGARAASLNANAPVVTSTREIRITAVYGGSSAETTLTVTPPKLESLVLNPTTVAGGGIVTGRVTFTGPVPAPITVNLSQSPFGSVTMPSFVNLAAGQTTATFNIQTVKTGFATSVTITAQAGGVSKTAKLTVTP